MPVNNDALDKAVLRALMTSPNCMMEKTINDKPLTVFEVQNYKILTALIHKEAIRIADEALGDYELLEPYPSNSNVNTRKRGRNSLRKEVRAKLKLVKAGE